MKVKVKIRRFNPEKDRKPHWAEYVVDAEPMDRVLDLLVQIKGYQDGSLTFRRSCAHGVCGSDALVINGHNRLACKVLVQDVGKHVTIEPLRGLPVIKDLAVDMEPFFRKYRRIQPFLINDEPPPYTERLQSAEARARFDEHHQVHFVRGMHHLVPQFLGQRQLPRPGGHRAGAPLHLRRPGPGRPGAAGHPG